MYLPTLDAEDLAARFDALRGADDQALMLLVAEHHAPELHHLVDVLGGRDIPFFGGIFPALIEGRRRREQGVLALPIRTLGAPILVRDPSAPADALARLAAALPDGRGPRPTLLVFVDGLAASISRFLADTYAELGTTVTYLGGGAGSGTLRPRPCVFHRDGVFGDAAVVAMTPWSCTPGVRHGYRRFAGPVAATGTDGNRILELNWEPAFEVYARALASRGIHVDRAQFLETARAYPFGLVKEGQEHVVRDPVAVSDEGALTCVGEVTENAVLSILVGEAPALVEAAAQAAADARPAPSARVHHRIVMDCISRAIWLEDRFAEELAAIEDAHGTSSEPGFGALTLGEISSRGDGYLEFFNKTAVVGVLHER